MDGHEICKTKSSTECYPAEFRDHLHNFMDLDEFLTVTANEMEEMKQKPRENVSNNTSNINDSDESQQCQTVADAKQEKEQNKPKDISETETSGNVGRRKKAQTVTKTSGPRLHHKSTDRKYWERREKNNVAAKRSRDAKRLKEISVLERWKLLEEKNSKLKTEVLILEEQIRTFQKESSHAIM